MIFISANLFAVFGNPSEALAATIILMAEEDQIEQHYGVHPADLISTQIREFFGITVH